MNVPPLSCNCRDRCDNISRRQLVAVSGRRAAGIQPALRYAAQNQAPHGSAMPHISGASASFLPLAMRERSDRRL